MFVPSFRVWSSWVQPPGCAAVTFVPPFQVTVAISRSPSLTLAGTARAMFAPAAVGPVVPEPTLNDAGSITWVVGSPLPSNASSGGQERDWPEQFQWSPMDELSRPWGSSVVGAV